MVTPTPELPDDFKLPRARFGFRAGLSARLLLFTGAFVLLAEVLIFAPSIANYRNSWLGERLSQARAAAVILEKAPDALPKAVVDELLLGMETTMIALRGDNMRRLLAISDMPPTVDFEIDLRQRDMLGEISNAFNILLVGDQRTIRVVGTPPKGGDFVEIVISERPLRQAMLGFSRNILLLSLAISVFAALLVYGALDALIVRPVKRLAEAVTRFRADPDDARTVFRPGVRGDELGILERNVADMQRTLQQELRQREHLANLGLAVAKINHDLRNMLASAQLMADRLGNLPDPNVQRFVPRLLDALDRAIAFCQSTLAYGKAQERVPELARIALAIHLREVGDQLMLSAASTPSLSLDVPEALTVLADAEHLGRVLTNILRNAVSALEHNRSASGAAAEISITARKNGDRVEIDIRDSGPGIPENLRERLFRAFSGSSRPGGTGLGLAIAQELMRAMGGSIALLEQGKTKGTTFRLTLPD